MKIIMAKIAIHNNFGTQLYMIPVIMLQFVILLSDCNLGTYCFRMSVPLFVTHFDAFHILVKKKKKKKKQEKKETPHVNFLKILYNFQTLKFHLMNKVILFFITNLPSTFSRSLDEPVKFLHTNQFISVFRPSKHL